MHKALQLKDDIDYRLTMCHENKSGRGISNIEDCIDASMIIKKALKTAKKDELQQQMTAIVA